MTKYKEYFDKMLKENKDAFNKFTLLHGNYENDEDKYSSVRRDFSAKPCGVR